MTKKELIEALEEFPDNAVIDVRLPPAAGDYSDYDHVVSGVEDFIGGRYASWVTLGLVD